MHCSIIDSYDLLRETRRKDDSGIGIPILERAINLVSANRDSVQLILARQQAINQRFDTIAPCSCRVHNRQRMDAAVIGKHQVQQRHNEQWHQKDKREGEFITQYLLNNAGGKRHNSVETNFFISSRLAE